MTTWTPDTTETYVPRPTIADTLGWLDDMDDTETETETVWLDPCGGVTRITR